MLDSDYDDDYYGDSYDLKDICEKSEPVGGDLPNWVFPKQQSYAYTRDVKFVDRNRVKDVHNELLSAAYLAKVEREKHELEDRLEVAEAQLLQRSDTHTQPPPKRQRLDVPPATSPHRDDHDAIIQTPLPMPDVAVGEAVTTPVAAQPSIDSEGVVRLVQRMRTTRARAPTGPAADIAFVLSAAPSLYPTINVHQATELLNGFLARPKQTLAKTMRALAPTARERQLACPILSRLVEVLDEVFTGSNFERATVVYTGTQAAMSVAQFVAELRLANPSTMIPPDTQRAASVLFQYLEIYSVFVDCAHVTTAQVCSFFKGSLCLNATSGQTALERVGPECWLKLCARIGYPCKPFDEYHGNFCTDHIVERSLYTAHKDRDKKTPADVLTNYAMLLSVFNGAGKMKVFGYEKLGWYGQRWSGMAKASLQFRLDFSAEHGRMPTVGEFKSSTHCKLEWQPTIALLPHNHPVHARATHRQAGIRAFM